MSEEYRKEVKQICKEATWTLRKMRKLIIPFFIFAVLVIICMWTVSGISQPAKIISKTIDADNALYNYEWFKQQHEDVLAIDIEISNSQGVVDNYTAMAGERKDWRRDDRIEYNRLSSVVLGLKNQRAGMIAKYNARSKMANRSLFKDNSLPGQMR